MTGQKEHIEPTAILDERGMPVNTGWARAPVFYFDKTQLWTMPRFSMAFDKYVIFSSTYMFVFELCSQGPLLFLHVMVVSLLKKQALSKIIRPHFSSKQLELMTLDFDSTIRFSYRNNLLEFIVMDGHARIIKVDIPQIGHNRRLRGEIVLVEPADAQSLYVHSCWPRENRRFRYIRSSPWWSIEGVMQFENNDIPFNKDRAWGVYYGHRGIRPPADLRYWAAGCGFQDNRKVSFNIAYGTDDGLQGTENAFFINGILHKLEWVTFHISPFSRMKPWKFTSSDNRLEMSFFPLQEQRHSNYFGLQFDVTNQLFGFFAGSFILDDGTVCNFSKITGIIERRKSKG